MPRPRTRRHIGKPEGVAKRPRRDREPYTYRGTGKQPGDRTYEVDGVEHRFDGTCHADCPDVR